MTLPLSPDMLACAYDYLACQLPFSKWNLPHSEDVKFAVIRRRDRQAHYFSVGKVHHIEFSSRYVGSHANMLSTMAHEMIHLHMQHACVSERNAHGRVFQKYADRICKIHGFDRLIF